MNTGTRYRRLLEELERLCSPVRAQLPPKMQSRLRVRVVDDWQDHAACASADPEAWFPDTQGAAVKPQVTRICAACPVRRSCLATALLWSVDGIWAGTTTREREDLIAAIRAASGSGYDLAQVLTEALNYAANRGHTGRSGNAWSGKEAA